MQPLPNDRDALLIYAAGFIRSATVSLVGVPLAIHLADVGFSTTQIGPPIGVGLAGSSSATVIVSLRGDAWGRRRMPRRKSRFPDARAWCRVCK